MSKGSWVVPAITTGIGLYNQYRSSRTNTTRRRKRRSDMDNIGATTYSRRRHRIGRRRRRSSRAVFNSLIGGGDHIVYRWQQLSSNILGPGRIPLGWSVGGNEFNEWLPFNFMSLTQNLGTPHSAKGCWDSGMKKIWYESSGSNNYFNVVSYPPQDHTGATASGYNNWFIEQSVGTSESGRKIYHSWTDVRLNLYGTLGVPITYNVYVMQFPMALDPQMSGLSWTQGTELYNMVKDMTRPLLGNPLNMNGRTDWPKDVRMLRKYSYTIQPLGYSDQAAIPSTGTGIYTGHVKQVKLFLRHDRVRDYNWSENSTDTDYDKTLSNLGWDVNAVDYSTHMSDVEHGKRIYLVITATSPIKETTQRASFVDTDYSWGSRQGSYDICVRNKFVFL